MKGSKEKYPLISVLIPTRNGAETIAELLSMLSIQTVPLLEVLVIDSCSDDSTVQIAKDYCAEVISVKLDLFDHGGTRTLISQKAKGDILIFFTQDCIPKKRNSIEKLIEPLLNDDDIVTSYGRQLPSFDANHFAVNLRSFNYPQRSTVRELKHKTTLGLATIFTSNSFASYRKSSLDGIGYFQDGLILGEDTVAVARLLLDGKKIAYVDDALVYHSHNYTPLEEFKRYFDIGVLHTSEEWLLDSFGNAEGRGLKYLKYELGDLYNTRRISLLPELCIRIVCKFIGYKMGRNYKILPKKIIPCLSMHSSWWNNSPAKQI